MKLARIGAGAAALAMATLASAPASAADWLVRLGGHNVDPKSDNGTLAGTLQTSVDSAASLTLNLDYSFTPNLALDVLAAVPFEHDIVINGSKAGSTKHLPPTVSLQYHFLPQAMFDPFVAVGLNYTTFMSEKLDSGAELKLDDSFGYALQAGVDYNLNKDWLVGADVRYIDISTEASVNGANVGTLDLNPLAYGLTVGRRF